jgi:D-3-phosphoglycerate dehydrogenase
MPRLRCAILDDYLNVSQTVADWSKVADRVDVTVFNQPFAKPPPARSGISRSSARCANARRFPAPCLRRYPI